MIRDLLLSLLAAAVLTPAWANPADSAAAANSRGDYSAELQITRPLAERGVPWAQVSLGISFELGRGVPQNHLEAVRWFRLAAIQGNAYAQMLLGVRYSGGINVPQDHAEAVKWFRMAAAQGDTSGQFLLGRAYADGLGVPQDHVKAHMWLNLAAIKGHADYAKSRDYVGASMTPQQIAEAQKMARDCLARNLRACD
jgi:TPR repeat protein